MFSCFWARPAPPPPLLKEWWKVPLTVAYMILGMALCWELAYKKDMIKNDINVNKHYQYLKNVCQPRWKQNPQTHSPFNLNNFIKDYFNPWLTSWNSPSIAPQHASGAPSLRGDQEVSTCRRRVRLDLYGFWWYIIWSGELQPSWLIFAILFWAKTPKKTTLLHQWHGNLWS